jgi:lipopolysaccharide transport system permease protein
MLNHLRLVWSYRALIWVLVRRELNARYRASALGFLWSLINPLLLLAVYAVVFTQIFAPRFVGGEPYPLFLFAGLLPWLFFSQAVLESAITLVDNGPLLAKVMCPPEIFPAVLVVSHLIHHLLALPVLIAAAAVAAAGGWHTFPWTLAALPLALGPWILATWGATAAVAATAVRLRDLRDLVGHLLNVLFFGSPIIYSLDGLGLEEPLRSILAANPFAFLVTAYRNLAFDGVFPDPLVLGGAWLTGVVVWCAGIAVFARLRDSLVESV